MKESSYRIMSVLDDYNDEIITRDEMYQLLNFPNSEEMFEMDKDMYINELEGLIKYQFAYNILKKHMDRLPDWARKSAKKELKELGL